MAATPGPVDLSAACAELDGAWQPVTVATVNDYDVRVARGDGEFPRHTHPETDELFLVLRGRLTIRREGAGDLVLGPGELGVLARGQAHQPVADPGTEFVLLEPSATVNTGDSPGERTAPRRVRGQA